MSLRSTPGCLCFDGFAITASSALLWPPLVCRVSGVKLFRSPRFGFRILFRPRLLVLPCLRHEILGLDILPENLPSYFVLFHFSVMYPLGVYAALCGKRQRTLPHSKNWRTFRRVSCGSSEGSWAFLPESCAPSRVSVLDCGSLLPLWDAREMGVRRKNPPLIQSPPLKKSYLPAQRASRNFNPREGAFTGHPFRS